jgi:hypothetical protein
MYTYTYIAFMQFPAFFISKDEQFNSPIEQMQTLWF